MKRWWLAVVIAAALPSMLPAQGRPVRRPVQRPLPRAGQPAIPGDTAGRDTAAVKWTPPDSVMEALMKRKGYTITRYEGGVLSFDALTQAIQIVAGTAHKAAVQRGDQTVVTDSTIRYNSQSRGITVTSRDTAGAGYVIVPGGGQAPITGRTTATYNLSERSGRINDASVKVDNGGNTWFVSPKVVKIETGDSTKNIPPRLYGTTASLTSCDDSVLPDYHFEVGEVKRTKNLMVGRPAVLYIGDVPVMWLPFFFQDIRTGRRSGMLTPRFGVADIIRNSPTYRRDIENIGWYWALNDYMDASAWMDWRSGTGGSSAGDPGWLRFNGEWRYRWRDRFLNGQIASSYTTQRNGQTNLAISWAHTQQFSRNSMLTANMNYVTSTQLQRQNTFNPYAALQTISSSINYQQKVGPAQVSIGGTRKQYPGRDQVDQTFPTVSVSTSPVEVASWLTWTPGFHYSASQSLHIDQPGLFSQRYGVTSDGLLDSTTVKRSSYQSSLSFDTPIQIFGWDLKNSFTINDQQNIFPQTYLVYPNPSDTSVHSNRVFASTYRTDVDWTPSFSLPRLGQNVLGLSPSLSFNNVDPGAFWVRSQFTGGKFVHQSKRPTFGLGMNPTIYGLWPGFGPFSRFRHTISPQITFSYAPAANVSDEYLAATNRTRQGYLGSYAQKAISLSLNQTFEAKLKAKEDTLNGGPSTAQPIQLLAVNLSAITYDFERASKTHRAVSGITNDNFSYSLSSQLLPGFSLNVGYSLFQGSTLSDSAVFKPFRNSMSASFTMSKDQNPLGFLFRMLGLSHDTTSSPAGAAPAPGPTPDQQFANQIAQQPVAGMQNRNVLYLAPVARSWSATFNFSSARTRPPVGGTVIYADPTRYCLPFKDPKSPSYNPPAYDLCVQQQSTAPTLDQPISNTASGGPVYVNPPTSSLSSNVQFPLTDKWSAAWRTTYNFQQHQFASQDVQLVRELHDWRAIFSFTQSPNGNFSFAFQIALTAEPDLKFNYNRGTYRSAGTP
ncbi:MAG TPA: putative LPS assembly protein LptD [Gemmatimonadaceae bacterium]|nr:putative LPS assembly protein LptD [Gemmatimonadaceae bacterium]